MLIRILFFLFFPFFILNAQCPGAAACPPGAFNNGYETINASSVQDEVFCSGQTRTFSIGVGPGTTTEAATGDVEFVTLFFDFDCDGIFEYSVNDSCSYTNPGGCTVDLEVTVPTVVSTTIYKGRAHLVYNTATTDPCADAPSSYGDVVDFTITVNLPPEPILTSDDVDNLICEGDSVTFTVTDGDEYEFYLNGSVVQAQSLDDTYTTSSLVNGDTLTARAFDTAGNCNEISSSITTTVVAPSINTQPVAIQTIFAGSSTTFSVLTTDIDTYQWQVSSNGGASYSNITNGALYAGTLTPTLTINASNLDLSGNLYRVISSNSVGCTPINSSSGLLNVYVRSVITNRRITYRVKRT